MCRRKLTGSPCCSTVEVRWPEGQKEAPTAEGKDEASIGLHSIPYFSHTVRASEYGPLWMEDAHQVDGRWVVPGAVSVFTSRGTRMLTVNTGGKQHSGIHRAAPRLSAQEESGVERLGAQLPSRGQGSARPGEFSMAGSEGQQSDPYREPGATSRSSRPRVGSTRNSKRGGRSTRPAPASPSAIGGSRWSSRGRPAPTTDATERFDRIDDVALLTGPRPAFLDPCGSAGWRGLHLPGGRGGRQAPASTSCRRPAAG